MGIFFGLSPERLITELWSGLVEYETLWILGVIGSGMFLSSLMSLSGMLEGMTEALTGLINDLRLTLVAIPALLGLIPMPAGALVSAVMVKDISDKLNAKPELRTFLNYWFRHVWEYIWPMYQAVVLVSTMFSIPITYVARINLPLTLTALSVGVAVAYLKLPKMETENLRRPSEALINLIRTIWPILLIIVLYFVIKVDLLISFVISLTLTIAYVRPSFVLIKEALVKAFDPWTLGAIAAIMLFKRVLEASRSIDSISTLMSALEVNPLITAALIPMLVGYMTGLSMAFVGIAFPLLKTVLLPGGNLSENMFMYAYGFGFVGMLITPLHLCLTLTIEFYKANSIKVYRYLIPAALVISLASITRALVFQA